MEEASKRLSGVLEERASLLPAEMRRRLQMASEIIVFGSFASALETKSSDLDVFCIGRCRTHFKSPSIEILILPEYDVYSELWLGSELANHISFYGVPLDARPEWFSHAQVGEAAAARKERRISAYIRSLEMHWHELSTGARSRYAIKVRRELQRLKLLQNGRPVPPTALLDKNAEPIWQMNALSSSALHESLFERFQELFPAAAQAETKPHF